MDLSGKPLEKIVFAMEDRLKPVGCTVVAGDKVIDEDTGQIRAEFDIRIRGPVGSSFINWLIECRDRKGPQPGAWIEQLIGRKLVHGFQHVIAVSTNGFTDSAVHAAKVGNILLRRVTTLEELIDDFGVTSMVKIIPHVVQLTTKILGETIKIRSTGDSVVSVQTRLDEIMVREVGGADFEDIPHFVNARHGIAGGANLDSEVTVRLHFEWPKQLELQIRELTLMVDGLELDYELIVRTRVPTGMSTNVYSEGNRPIGQIQESEFEVPGGIVRMEVSVLYRGDGSAEVDTVRLEAPEGFRPDQLYFFAKPDSVAPD